ncbi:hypothetical protein AAHC03_05164 [Spirometra sp. Aus1]
MTASPPPSGVSLRIRVSLESLPPTHLTRSLGPVAYDTSPLCSLWPNQSPAVGPEDAHVFTSPACDSFEWLVGRRRQSRWVRSEIDADACELRLDWCRPSVLRLLARLFADRLPQKYF